LLSLLKLEFGLVESLIEVKLLLGEIPVLIIVLKVFKLRFFLITILLLLWKIRLGHLKDIVKLDVFRLSIAGRPKTIRGHTSIVLLSRCSRLLLFKDLLLLLLGSSCSGFFPLPLLLFRYYYELLLFLVCLWGFLFSDGGGRWNLQTLWIVWFHYCCFRTLNGLRWFKRWC
jgi:hypothetical protein